MNDKLTTTPLAGGNSLTKRRSIGMPALHQRIATPQATVTSDTMPNRIALLLDCSGSMAGRDAHSKINLLKDAMTSFVNACNFADTALAIETFPSDNSESEIGSQTARVPLTTVQPFLMTSVMMLRAGGSTPMAEAMEYALKNYSLTRAVLVSDGDANDPRLVYCQVDNYAEAQIPVDCVHIGDSSGGEDTLRSIAERTGGKFMKFTDISSFAKNFHYLTPAFYAQLTSGSVTAAMLGAKEIK